VTRPSPDHKVKRIQEIRTQHAPRDELIGDLGGDTAISTQRRALVDLVVRRKLMLDSIDAWLLKRPSLVNVRKRSLLPVVRA
jgi:hypothetical protein